MFRLPILVGSQGPEWTIGLCYHEYLGDESAGFTIYLDSGEPVQIEKVI